MINLGLGWRRALDTTQVINFLQLLTNASLPGGEAVANSEDRFGLGSRGWRWRMSSINHCQNKEFLLPFCLPPQEK